LGFQQFAKVLLSLQSLFVFQFILELRQLFLFQLFYFALQPTRVELLGVVTQVFQLSFFVQPQVVASPFILVIQFCFFPR